MRPRHSHASTLALLGSLALQRSHACSTPIREHNLKRFFMDPRQIDVELSPSYAQSITMADLLELEPDARNRLNTLGLSSYTEDCGRGELAEAVAAQYKGIKPEDVLVLSGVDAVIMDTLSALTSPGTRVLLQTPEYPPLRNVPLWRGADVLDWQPSDGWDLSALDSSVNCVICCLPHSPFGWSPDEAWLRQLVERTDALGQTLIVDEVYRGIDLTLDGSGLLPSACELSPRAVVIGGLAKTYGLTGLRIGWVVCRDAKTRAAIETHALNGNTNVCAPTELLGGIAIRQSERLHARNAEVARANLEAVEAFVRRSGGLFSWTRPTAGLLAWLKWEGPSSARQLAQSVLEHERILVADHTLFGIEDGEEGGALRIGLGPVDMPERLEALEAAVARFVSEQ